jgi:hypothetical protein
MALKVIRRIGSTKLNQSDGIVIAHSPQVSLEDVPQYRRTSSLAIVATYPSWVPAVRFGIYELFCRAVDGFSDYFAEVQ